MEEKLASDNLRKYEDNVLSCTSEIEKLYKEIICLKPETYDDNQFLTQLLCALGKTTNESFERTVEVVIDKWILGDATCTIAYVIKTCNTKYRNLEVSNVWNNSSNKDNDIIALTTALNDQRMNFEEFQNNYNKNRNNKIEPNKKNPSSD